MARSTTSQQQQQLAPIPDGPEFEKTLSEQVDLILDEVRLSTTTSVGRLFEWITQNPGPEAAATAAYGVLARTKVPYVPGEKRLGLLYAVHEVFKQASKDVDMVFDYEAWKEALQSLVPWTYRKQKEDDQSKIRKSVLKMWVSSRWLDREFVESLIPAPGSTPKKRVVGDASGGGSGGSKRRRASLSGRSLSSGSLGGGGSNPDSHHDSNMNSNDKSTSDKSNQANAAATKVKMKKGEKEDAEQEAVFDSMVDYGNGTPTQGAAAVTTTKQESRSGSAAAAAVTTAAAPKLPFPAPGAVAAAESAGLPEAPRNGLNGGGGGGGGAGGGGGGANTVTPSPEGDQADIASPDGAGVGAGGQGGKESAQEAQRRMLSLTLDGCGLIRRIGRSMKFPVRVMLTAFHLFHHYQWCGSVEAFRFPPSSLPAVCLACLVAATKAEDCNAKLDTLLKEMRQLDPLLPPMDGVFPLGKMPNTKEVITFEYKLLLSRGFDLEMVHPTEHIATLLAVTRAPIEVGEMAYEVLCSRIYTDSTLCLEEDPMTCLCAAVQFSLLSPTPGGRPLEEMRKGMLDDWPVLCGATKAVLLSYTERLVQSARDLAEFAPAQTFMIPRGVPDANQSQQQHHHHGHTAGSNYSSATRAGLTAPGASGSSGGGGSGGAAGVSKSLHASKALERARGHRGSGDRAGRADGVPGSDRRKRTPPRINVSRPKVVTSQQQQQQHQLEGGTGGVVRGPEAAGGMVAGAAPGPAAVVVSSAGQVRPQHSSPSPPSQMQSPVVENSQKRRRKQQQQQQQQQQPPTQPQNVQATTPLVLETTGTGAGMSLVLESTGKSGAGATGSLVLETTGIAGGGTNDGLTVRPQPEEQQQHSVLVQPQARHALGGTGPSTISPPASVVLESTGRGSDGGMTAAAAVAIKSQTLPTEPTLMSTARVAAPIPAVRVPPSVAVQLQQQLHAHLKQQRRNQNAAASGADAASQPPRMAYRYNNQPPSNAGAIASAIDSANAGDNTDDANIPATASAAVAGGPTEEPRAIPHVYDGAGGVNIHPLQNQQQPQVLDRSPRHPRSAHDSVGRPVGHGSSSPQQAVNGLHGHDPTALADTNFSEGQQQQQQQQQRQRTAFMSGSGEAFVHDRTQHQRSSTSPVSLGGPAMLPLQPQQEQQERHHHHPLQANQGHEHEQRQHQHQQQHPIPMLRNENPPPHHNQHYADRDHRSSTAQYGLPPEGNNRYSEENNENITTNISHNNRGDNHGDNHDGVYPEQHEQQHYHQRHPPQREPTVKVGYNDGGSSGILDPSGSSSGGVGSGDPSTGPGGFPVGPSPPPGHNKVSPPSIHLGQHQHHLQQQQQLQIMPPIEPALLHNDDYASQYHHPQQQQGGVADEARQFGTGGSGDGGGGGSSRSGASFVGGYLQLGRVTSEPAVSLGEGEGMVDDSGGWQPQQEQLHQQQVDGRGNMWTGSGGRGGGPETVTGDAFGRGDSGGVGGGDGFVRDGDDGLMAEDDEMQYATEVPSLHQQLPRHRRQQQQHHHPQQHQQQHHLGSDWEEGGTASEGW